LNRSAALAVGLAFGAGVLVGVPVSDAGYDYTWRNADFCDDCHVHDYANEQYRASRHVGVTTCHDCHRVPIMHYPMNIWKVATIDYVDPSQVHTPDVPTLICAACHIEGSHEELTGPMTAELRAEVVKVGESPLHALHLEQEHDDRPVTCLDCHGSGGGFSAHRFESTRERCLVCHEGISPEQGRLDQLECRDCHLQGFVNARGERSR
jgi:hypothetical protein